MAKENQETNIIKQGFDSFNVYSLKDCFSFFHIDVKQSATFYEKLFEYFFSEDKLIKYCENRKNIKFEPSVKNFATLFKHLKTYIDSEYLEKSVAELDEILLPILKEEMELKTQDGKYVFRLDKIGKIGEYMFCCLLSDFFHFDCIIPKVHLQTDYNMSVYGIDTLFYSEKDHLLLFGESKLCININNGIGLINKSLSEYEKQLSDEFDLVLCNRCYKDKLNKFNEIFGDVSEICLNINDFIKKAAITKIGVPIFIAHGIEVEHKQILEKLSKIKFKQFFGLETQYYSISLPIIDKNKLIAVFTNKIREKEDYYKEEYYKHAIQ